MTPSRPAARAAAARVEGVEAELAQERAATLKRAGDRLADALWRYVVTREACGLRDAESVMRELEVPPEVRRRMGPAPARPSRSPGGAGSSVTS